MMVSNNCNNDENNEITTVEESTDVNGNNVVETTLPSDVYSNKEQLEKQQQQQ